MAVLCTIHPDYRLPCPWCARICPHDELTWRDGKFYCTRCGIERKIGTLKPAKQPEATRCQCGHERETHWRDGRCCHVPCWCQQFRQENSDEQETPLQGEAPTEPAPAAAVGLVDAGQPTELQALCRELAEAEALVLKVLVLNPLIDVVYRYVSEPAARDALEQAICDQAAVLAERLAVFAATLKQDEAKGA